MFCGSNQSGKTTALLVDLLDHALGVRLWDGSLVHDINGNVIKPPVRILLGAEDYVNAHAEVIIPKLNELLPLDLLGVEEERIQGRITHKFTFPRELGGSSIKLMSYEADQSKWEGYTAHYFGFDEPPPRHALIGVRRGAMRHSAQIGLSFTPLKEAYLFYDYFLSENAVHINKNDDVVNLKKEQFAVVSVDLSDTPYISEANKARFVAGLSEEEREARQHGRFFHLMGRVYRNFDRGKHVLDPIEWFAKHPEWRTYPGFLVVDPHDRKPFAMAWGIVTPLDETIFLDEWPNFNFYKTNTYKAGVDDYKRIIEEKEREIWGTLTEGVAAGVTEEPEPNVQLRIIDPNFGKTAKAGTGISLVDAFADRGMWFDASVDDNLESGHLAVKTDLEAGKLFWMPKCVNFITGMDAYTWDEYRGKSDRAAKEAPKDKFKDFPDLARYARKYPVRYVEPGAMTPKWNLQEISNGGLG
jgi:phage terminase large subunit-like protein